MIIVFPDFTIRHYFNKTWIAIYNAVDYRWFFRWNIFIKQFKIVFESNLSGVALASKDWNLGKVPTYLFENVNTIWEFLETDLSKILRHRYSFSVKTIYTDNKCNKCRCSVCESFLLRTRGNYGVDNNLTFCQEINVYDT